jgi:hypothetical protein
MTSPLSIIPGAREPGMLTTFGVPVWTIRDGPSTMDAVTIAEHQREGGGAPNQRRPVRVRTRSTRPSGRFHELLVAARELFAWRVRTRHV